MIPRSRRSPGEGIGYPLQYSWASLVAQVKNPNVGDMGSIPGLGRCPGEGIGYPLLWVLWPGEFHGLYSPWGLKESDTTERLSLHLADTPAHRVFNVHQNLLGGL